MFIHDGKNKRGKRTPEKHMFIDDRKKVERRGRKRIFPEIPPPEKPFKCETCESSFSQETTLRLHLLSHESETFSCETCLAEFTTLGSLQKHCLVKHADDHTLPQTGDKTLSKKVRYARYRSDYTKRHYRDIIGEVEELVPAQSNKASVNNVAAVRERCMIYVDRKMFSCEHCGKFFVSIACYEKHLLAHDVTLTTLRKLPKCVKRIKNLEASSVPKQCIIDQGTEESLEKLNEECESQEITVVNLSSTHINKELNSKVLPKSKKGLKKSAKQPKKNHVCEVCQRQLTSARSLANHLKTHAPHEKYKICLKNKSERQDPIPHETTVFNDFTFANKKPEHNNIICSIEKADDQDPACHCMTENIDNNNSICLLTEKTKDSTSRCLTEKTKSNDITRYQENNEADSIDNGFCQSNENSVGNNDSDCYILNKTITGNKDNDCCHSNKNSGNTDNGCLQSNKAVKEVFKCNICKKSYRLKIALMSHMISHSPPKLKCEVCQKEFFSNKLLKLHFRSHSDVRIFFCEVCNKGFKHKHHLRIHFITHTDEKPYVCDVCNRAFKHKWGLKEHSLTHEKDPPFVCHVCNMGFFVKLKHKKHLLQHGNEMAFKCEYCGLGFNLQHLLRKHVAFECNLEIEPSMKSSQGNGPSLKSNLATEPSMESSQLHESSIKSNLEMKHFVKSSQESESSMEPSQLIERSIKSNRETELVFISVSEKESSMEIIQAIESPMVSKPKIQPSIASSQKMEPSAVSNQQIEPSMVSKQEKNSSMVSNLENKISTISNKGIEITKPLRKVDKDSATVVPLKGSTRRKKAKMSLKESSKVKTDISLKASISSNMKIASSTILAETSQETEDSIEVIDVNESSQDVYSKVPIVTEMTFEESSNESSTDSLLAEREQLHRELTMQVLLKKSTKK